VGTLVTSGVGAGEVVIEVAVGAGGVGRESQPAPVSPTTRASTAARHPDRTMPFVYQTTVQTRQAGRSGHLAKISLQSSAMLDECSRPNLMCQRW
jgi:hypothetical protein